MSTLSDGEQIKRRFYELKAQEWACEPYEARRHVEAALRSVSNFFRARREDDNNSEK